MRVHFAVGMGRNEKIYEIADHSRVAEESGFRHVTFGDVQNCTRDLYVKMAMAATSTSMCMNRSFDPLVPTIRDLAPSLPG